MAFGDPQIAKPLLSAAITEVDLGTYDIRAENTKQRIADMNMLTRFMLTNSSSMYASDRIATIVNREVHAAAEELVALVCSEVADR